VYKLTYSLTHSLYCFPFPGRRELNHVHKTSISSTNTSSPTIAPFTDSFSNDSLMQTILCLSQSLFQLAGMMASRNFHWPKSKSCSHWGFLHIWTIRWLHKSGKMNSDVSHARCQWNRQRLQFSSEQPSEGEMQIFITCIYKIALDS